MKKIKYKKSDIDSIKANDAKKKTLITDQYAILRDMDSQLKNRYLKNTTDELLLEDYNEWLSKLDIYGGIDVT